VVESLKSALIISTRQKMVNSGKISAKHISIVSDTPNSKKVKMFMIKVFTKLQHPILIFA
jgi:hypothetical protein